MIVLALGVFGISGADGLDATLFKSHRLGSGSGKNGKRSVDEGFTVTNTYLVPPRQYIGLELESRRI